MKNSDLLVVLSLALCCFSGVNSDDADDESKISCTKYFIHENFIACPHVFRPVCGTNEKTYDNECEICKENLNSGKNHGKKYHGKCAAGK